MNRRQILSGTVAIAGIGAIGGVGYTWSHDDSAVSMPEQVTELSFETDHPPEGWYLETDDPGPEDDPVITPFGDDGRVEITGSLWIGSRDCEEAVVNDVTFDSTASRLRVTIGWDEQSRTLRERLGGRSCGEALGSERYTLSLVVDSQVRTIEAIEHDHQQDTRSTVHSQ